MFNNSLAITAENYFSVLIHQDTARWVIWNARVIIESYKKKVCFFESSVKNIYGDI